MEMERGVGSCRIENIRSERRRKGKRPKRLRMKDCLNKLLSRNSPSMKLEYKPKGIWESRE
jgi:hypothetical protein